MQDYKKLYHIMFNAATDAELELESGNISAAKKILVRAQQRAEDEYLILTDDSEPR